MTRTRHNSGFADVLADLKDKTLRKVVSKVPEWEGTAGLQVAASINAEQCSGSATARYKAALALSLAVHPGARQAKEHGTRIADLTGGLGVDSWFFSREFDEVLYCEIQEAYCKAAAHNFKILGADNILVRQHCSAPDQATKALLEDFKPDVIFLDPARRNSSGSKVFRLEDCEPNLLGMLLLLRSCSRWILAKVSPMADIALLSRQLGPCLKEIHIVQSKSELKELLLVISGEKEEYAEPLITVADADNLCEGAVFSFRRSEEEYAASARRMHATEGSTIREGSIIFEPGPALAKSGAFNLIASRIGATQLDRSTHLYLNPGEEPPRQFGKIWQVIEVQPFGGKSLKDISRRYSDAEVSARGIPMTSEEMRRKMGLKSGGGVHIFGVGVSPEINAEGIGNAKGRMLLLVCRRV
ncbi:MAG: class I SAM-dependent methyltransferase [Candidatus Cryptobacteroides sp.]|nr:class I SAM-dependent methyltransferase [Candidatus Cryptobacteroides sp.]